MCLSVRSRRLDNVSSHEHRLLVGEVGDISKDGLCVLRAHGFTQVVGGVEDQCGPNGIERFGTVSARSVLGDLPSFEAVLAPAFLDERHVGGQVVLHVELDVVVVGI